MGNYIAFLRAVNVAGKNRLKMQDLRSLCETAGCREVRTVLQSGNVIFRAEKVPDLGRILEKALGVRPEVFYRKETQIRNIVNSEPFGDYPDISPSHQLVMFLENKISSVKLAKVKTEREVLWTLGREICITFPDGIGRSKLSNQSIEKALGVKGTMRNMNTLVKILAACE